MIVYSSDGEHWSDQTINHMINLHAIYGTNDGRSLWTVGDYGTIVLGSATGRILLYGRGADLGAGCARHATGVAGGLVAKAM